MKTILLINGPNLNLLGVREPEIYGRTTLSEIETMVTDRAEKHKTVIVPCQSNHEGDLIDFIQAEYDQADGIIINPGALTHYSYALRDCLSGVGLPIVEVHISDLQKREEWRRHSVFSDIRDHLISGQGTDGYMMALDYLIKLIADKEE